MFIPDFIIPDFRRSDCASWVQAWGSVAAIVVAIWLGRQGELGRKHGAFNHYVLFKATVRDCLQRAWKKAQSHDLPGVLYAQATIHDAVQLGQTVPLHLLPDLDALTATRFRSLIAEASGFLDHTIATSRNVISYQHVEGEFARMLAQLKEIDGVHRPASAETAAS